MTNEQVDKIEAVLREAQNKIEEAGRLLCNERGDCAPWIWGQCYRLSENITDMIHRCWKLRPDEPMEENNGNR